MKIGSNLRDAIEYVMETASATQTELAGFLESSVFGEDFAAYLEVVRDV